VEVVVVVVVLVVVIIIILVLNLVGEVLDLQLQKLGK